MLKDQGKKTPVEPPEGWPLHNCSRFSIIFPLVVQKKIILSIGLLRTEAPAILAPFTRMKDNLQNAGRGQSFSCEEEMRHLACGIKAFLFLPRRISGMLRATLAYSAC